MRTIETKVTIDSNGVLTAQLPNDVPAGVHQAVLVMEIQKEMGNGTKRPLIEFPVHHGVSWPDNLSLRREDIYDEWGR